MARRVRYHEQFRADLAQTVGWLTAHREGSQRQALRSALDAFVRRVATHPEIGVEVFRRGTHPYRVFPVGGSLPYLVWYDHDRTRGVPVSFLMLLHESQDRERFDPDAFDGTGA